MTTPWQIRDKDVFIKELSQCIKDLYEAGYDNGRAYPQFHTAVAKHVSVISDADEVCAPPVEEYADDRDMSGRYEP